MLPPRRTRCVPLKHPAILGFQERTTGNVQEGIRVFETTTESTAHLATHDPFPGSRQHDALIKGGRHICLSHCFSHLYQPMNDHCVPCKFLPTAHVPVIAPGTP